MRNLAQLIDTFYKEAQVRRRIVQPRGGFVAPEAPELASAPELSESKQQKERELLDLAEQYNQVAENAIDPIIRLKNEKIRDDYRNQASALRMPQPKRPQAPRKPSPFERVQPTGYRESPYSADFDPATFSFPVETYDVVPKYEQESYNPYGGLSKEEAKAQAQRDAEENKRLAKEKQEAETAAYSAMMQRSRQNALKKEREFNEQLERNKMYGEEFKKFPYKFVVDERGNILSKRSPEEIEKVEAFLDATKADRERAAAARKEMAVKKREQKELDKKEDEEKAKAVRRAEFLKSDDAKQAKGLIEEIHRAESGLQKAGIYVTLKKPNVNKGRSEKDKSSHTVKDEWGFGGRKNVEVMREPSEKQDEWIEIPVRILKDNGNIEDKTAYAKLRPTTLSKKGKDRYTHDVANLVGKLFDKKLQLAQIKHNYRL